MLESELQQPVAAGESQLFADVRSMRIYRPRTGAAFDRDLPRSHSRRDALKDAALGGCKPRETRLTLVQPVGAAAPAQEKI